MERTKTEMYSYEWDPMTRGYILTTRVSQNVANEIRPVFAQELSLLGMDRKFTFDRLETRPLMWAQKNNYFFNGEKVAIANGVRYGKPIEIEYSFDKRMKLQAVDVDAMVKSNTRIMSLVVADAKRRVKEMYDSTVNKSDIAYIAFSGGKDSVVTLDICHQTLPLSVPVIYSDTDMELPSSVDYVWSEIQKLYSDREFIKVKAETSSIENWKSFGPPSRTIRWCCSVHKSTPAIMYLKKRVGSDRIKAVAFLGIRGEESQSRSNYDDISFGVKNASQTNCMPILDWSSHELWLYIFMNKLIINPGYLSGLTRVGCVLCPESSGRHTLIVSKLFPDNFKEYANLIIQTSDKTFKTKQDEKDFIGGLAWHARQSGVVLRDPIISPIESNKGLLLQFKSVDLSKQRFFEWIKTIGFFRINPTRSTEKKKVYDLSVPVNLDGKRSTFTGITFVYDDTQKNKGDCVSFLFPNVEVQTRMLPLVRSLIKKVVSCVGCRTCEANCIFGAITTTSNGVVHIDSNKCVHCRTCYEISKACWRFRSMAFPETVKTSDISINAYKKFGLREDGVNNWITVLVERGEEFFPWNASHPLGNKMVESARVWFSHAELIDAQKKPTKLVELFQKKGTVSVVGWEFIWFTLANNSRLIKWFVSDIDFNIEFTTDELMLKLSSYFPTYERVTLEGSVISLKDMLTKSPLGVEELQDDLTRTDKLTESAAVVSWSKSGKKFKSITRHPKNIHSLTLLYSLYLVARNTERSAFTVREMLTSDKNAPFVSPIVAFGIDSETFRRQCEGLRSRYPEYISTVFTHGNDEIEVFPDRHSLDDIIALCISEL